MPQSDLLAKSRSFILFTFYFVVLLVLRDLQRTNDSPVAETDGGTQPITSKSAGCDTGSADQQLQCALAHWHQEVDEHIRKNNQLGVSDALGELYSTLHVAELRAQKVLERHRRARAARIATDAQMAGMDNASSASSVLTLGVVRKDHSPAKPNVSKIEAVELTAVQLPPTPERTGVLQRNGLAETLTHGIHLDAGLLAFSHFITPVSRPAPAEITLSIFTPLTSLDRLGKVAAAWNGPISCSVWIADTGSAGLEQVSSFIFANPRNFSFTAIHALWSTPTYSGLQPPVAHLLNVAVSAAHSEFVLVLDSLPGPSFGMFEHLSGLLNASLGSTLRLSKTALLVPVLQLDRRVPEAPSKQSLALELRAAPAPSLGSLSNSFGSLPSTPADALAAWVQGKGVYDSRPDAMASATVVSRRLGLLPRFLGSFLERCGDPLRCWFEELLAAGYRFTADAESFFVHVSDSAPRSQREEPAAEEGGGRKRKSSRKERKERLERRSKLRRAEVRARSRDSANKKGYRYSKQRFRPQTFEEYLRRYTVGGGGGMLFNPATEAEQCPCGAEECGQGAGGVAAVRCGVHEIATVATVQNGAVRLDGELYAFTHWGRPLAPVERSEVTLTTQLEVDKLDRLVTLAVRWGGPVSAAVLVEQHGEAMEELSDALEEHSEALRRTSVHLVYGETSPHPINYLRNVAMDGVESDFVFVVDVDLVPNPGIREEVQRWLEDAELGARVRHQQAALVVPVFEQPKPRRSKRYRKMKGKSGEGKQPVAVGAGALPADKSELRAQFQREELQVFHPYHVAGQNSTDYQRWFSRSHWDKPYNISWFWDYEPYLVVGKGLHGLTPRFHGPLRGFGFNKAVWVQELYVAGFSFVVLPHAFLVHIYHDGGGKARRPAQTTRKIVNDFRTELQRKYELSDALAFGRTRERDWGLDLAPEGAGEEGDDGEDGDDGDGE